MSIRHLLLRNTLSQSFAQMVSMATGLVTSAVLSRHLGVDGFGQFNYLFAFFAFLSAVNDVGVNNTAVVREVSRHPAAANRILGGVLPLKFSLSILILFLAWLVVFRHPFPLPLRQSLAIFGLLLPLTALQLPVVTYQAHLRLDRLSLLAIANRAIAFALLMGVVYLGFHLRAAALALVVAEGIYLLLLLKGSQRYAQPVWHTDPRLWKSILRSSIPLGLMSLLVAVVNRSAFLLLERWSDPHRLGLYAAAYKVTSLSEGLPLMAMGTLYPLFCRYASEDRLRLRGLYWKSLLGMSALGLALGLFVTLFSAPIVRKIFGSSFADASQVLSILIWATVFLYSAISGGNLLIAVGRERVNLGILLIASVLCIGLNVLWIPSRGPLGAAFAQAATYAFILAANLVCVERYFRGTTRTTAKTVSPYVPSSHPSYD